jgi:hypothetical protein
MTQLQREVEAEVVAKMSPLVMMREGRDRKIVSSTQTRFWAINPSLILE